MTRTTTGAATRGESNRAFASGFEDNFDPNASTGSRTKAMAEDPNDADFKFDFDEFQFQDKNKERIGESTL